MLAQVKRLKQQTTAKIWIVACTCCQRARVSPLHGDIQKGRAPFGRLNEGCPEGREIRNLSPLACLCFLSARAERKTAGRQVPVLTDLPELLGNLSVAELNPLRYRGYYCDSETGFYYLQSRYYDPIVRRFLNGDSFASTGQGILGYNMSAYCNNNPMAC